ncbi:MAG: Gfo/Idh/MocA family protein [Verrucomicrobiaceae bacterium]
MSLPKVLVLGTGEYVTGFVNGAESSSDKGAGVVGVTLFDLRQRGLVGEVLMAGTQGVKFPAVRAHLETVVGERYGMEVGFRSFPGDEVERDGEAWKAGMDELEAGDVVMVFTPDDLHFEMAREAVERGLHVLVAKPIVKTVAEHEELARKAEEKGLLVAMEVHKRWDPIYADARERIRGLGDFSYFQSYMSQPKSQLESFRAWAGKASDISYYLNAHHIDFHVWAMEGVARPVSVVASGSTGVAEGMGIATEDSITLMVDWVHEGSGNRGTAVYTSAWSAPKAEVHSQQKFSCLSHGGEVRVDQAHRGYEVATDGAGYATPNPLFMRYLPNGQGGFAGQGAYGYASIAAFVEAARSVRAGESRAEDWESRLATVKGTKAVTAILEAGRKSLDGGGVRIDL